MLFNSISYVVFLPIVFAFYWTLPHKYRWVVLLVASYYFYMSWNYRYVVIIIFATFLSYVSARLICFLKSQSVKKCIMYMTIVCCLSILFVFKYFSFAVDSIVGFASLFSVHIPRVSLDLLLPVGISFYTFQTMSYVIDVYRGAIEAEKDFGKYATFVAFFPQLVAGPIERSQNLLPQIKAEHKFDERMALEGAKLMLLGYYKKLVIADNVSIYVDRVYENVAAYRGLDLIVAIFFFSIQIYCDFSGYSDIAIGTAKLFGINLMTNFRSPYYSASIKEFWSRWHISLSTWFRDYFYIPLGGNRCSKKRNMINIMLTFVVSGLWHGANWTFLVWGGIHGLAQICERLLSKQLDAFKECKSGKLIRIIIVFLFCNVAWIFFRASSIQEAIYVLGHALTGVSNPGQFFTSNMISPMELMVLLIYISLLAIYDYVCYMRNDDNCLSLLGSKTQWLIYVIIGLIIVFASRKGVPADFVYFQF